MRKYIAVLLCLALCLCFVGCGKKTEPRTADTVVQEMLIAYGYKEHEADEEVASLLEELRGLDEAKAAQMETLMALWRECDELPTYDDLLPAGLPEDDTLCIVVLGFELNDDGSMQPELVGRLETALACAEEYPNAYVICTGGGTAAKNPDVTEAGLMGEWLLAHGLEEARLMVENKSLTTAENALFSAEILAKEHPQVTSLAVVSSSYHLRWGTLLFRTAYLLAGNDTVKVISNAGYPTVNEKYADTHRFMGGGMLQILGYQDMAMKVYLDELEY